MSVKLAEMIATKYHAGQMYGEDPYSKHLHDVVNNVILRYGSTDDRLIQIAWLHDVMEDTTCPMTVLNELFEDNVVTAVIALTKNSFEPREEYIARVKANALAKKVKLCDAYSNFTASWFREDHKRIIKYAKLIADLEA